jgi:hypothetical protein
VSGFGPVAATPVAAVWPSTRSFAAAGTVRVRDLPAAQSLWAIEIAAPGGGGGQPRPAPFGMVSGLPVGAVAMPASASVVQPVFASDRGWIGEPDDPDAPNQPWPSRLLEPPALELGLPLYPSEGRRAEVAAGELLLANADGGLDSLLGDGRLAGRSVIIRRGPHLRPRHARAADIGRVAEMRVRAPLGGNGRVRLTLESLAADLSVPACSTYAGTGGPEGGSELTGQAKPRLLGVRQNFPPVQVSSALEIFQLNDGAITRVVAARNRGVPQVFTADVATYADLAALTLPEGRYATCLAGGYVRFGSATSLVTVAARGDVGLASIGYAAGSPMSIALKLLRGPAGITAARATPEAFAGWPTAEAGLWVEGGTVAEAMEQLAAGVGGWWGGDAFGSYRGGVVVAPEGVGAGLALEPWMLAAPPEEVDLAEPPWFRARVGFQVLDRLMAGEDVAPLVGGAERAFLTQASRLAQPAYDPGVQSLPSAIDGPELDSVFDAEAPAAAMAWRLLGLFGKPRRSWRLPLRTGTGAIVPQMVMPGAVLTLTWPDIAALRQPKPLLVRDLSVRGDSLTLTVWG